jgi:hypothetical protein
MGVDDRPTLEVPVHEIERLLEGTLTDTPLSHALQATAHDAGRCAASTHAPQPSRDVLLPAATTTSLGSPRGELASERSEEDKAARAELRTTYSFATAQQRVRSLSRGLALSGGLVIAALPVVLGTIHLLSGDASVDQPSAEAMRQPRAAAALTAPMASDATTRPLAPRLRLERVAVTGNRSGRLRLLAAPKASALDADHGDSIDTPATPDGVESSASRQMQQVLVTLSARGLARKATSARVEVNGLVLETERDEWPLQLLVFLPDAQQGDFSLRAWALLNGEVVGAAERVGRVDPKRDESMKVELDPAFDAGTPPLARAHAQGADKALPLPDKAGSRAASFVPDNPY